METYFTPKTKNSEIVEQKFRQEILLYDLDRHQVFCLNETMAQIWKHCNGNHSISEIAEKIASETKTKVTDDLVWLGLQILEKNFLLERNLPKKISKNTRRILLKKVGISTVIALPMISTLIAPTSLIAQSGARGRGVGEACNDNVRACRPELTCIQGHPTGAFCCNLTSPCASASDCCSVNTCYLPFGNICLNVLNPGGDCTKNRDCLSNSCNFSTPGGFPGSGQCN